MNFQTSRRAYNLSFAIIIFSLLALMGYFHLLDQNAASAMLHEDGAVEKISALGYFLCLLVMLLMGGSCYFRNHFPLVAVVTFFGFRELDFDKRFTETGLLQSRILTSPDVGLLERVAGIALIILLTVLVVYVLRRYTLVFVRRLLALEPAAIGVGVAVGLTFLSKTIDGVGRKLQPLGITISDDAAFSSTVVEEVCELGIPITLIVATIAYLQRTSKQVMCGEPLAQPH